jgi:regulator of cell morphogenesis and NO signaling
MNSDSRTLSELVAADSSRAKVLDELGLDYCCRGAETLDHACARAGIDADAVMAALTEADAKTVPDDHNCAAMSPTALVTHLLDSHHTYLHRELPDLDRLAAKVLDVHGERHPELARVRELMTDIVDDLEPHMLKEERVLFPSILRLLEGQRQFPFGSIRNPIAMMSIEHERVGELLAELRSVTSGYRVPDDSCESYRALYERLAALEHDTHLHVFEENHLLFPQAAALEGSA